MNTSEQQDAIRNGETSIKLGEYEICDLSLLPIDSNVPIYSDGEVVDTYYSEDDILLEGFVCGTNQRKINNFLLKASSCKNCAFI